MTADGLNQPTQKYDNALIALLESVYDKGFMSPGGTKEVDRILEGIDLSGFTLLDIGCGLGGATVHLARSYGPAKIIGIDIEENLIERCGELAARAGVAQLTEFRCVEPGPLPVGDAGLDFTATGAPARFTATGAPARFTATGAPAPSAATGAGRWNG